ncbi:MAG: hypothetical protein A2V64_00885 [Bacteroidetes bacterium RBG_13_43_22]|nr:MAG: hypothetical protein A2V64_00885 [Bacteroidetes bacterium RBG_13_43_22]
MKKTGIPENIDQYISQFPGKIQTKLKQIRAIIKKTAPDAGEKISYQMPAFFLKGILVYFAAQKNHIGFYPTASGVAAFKEELEGYKTGKGSIQFPLEEPLPLNLIRDIVKFRVMESLEKAKNKR